MINSTSLNDLTPATKAKAEALIAQAAARGITLKVTSTYRDAEYQDSLYAKGRTAPGQKVTNLSGNKSIHTSRQAFDVVPIVNGKADYGTTGASADRWATVGQIGQALGLEWGGAWKSFKDLPHFQMPGAKPGVAAPPAIAAQPPGGNVAQKPTDDATSSSTAQDKIKDSRQAVIIDLPPIPNRLHDYPSYIYSLSWHLMTEEQYNNVVVTQKYNPTDVLVASAGRHSATFPRNKFFSEDFYFDNFDLTTIICPNDYSRNTNAINCNFTLIEPYGFTLVERLLKAADALKIKNYLYIPYLIQIDFFAIDEAGQILGSIDELRKRIPVRLDKMDVKLTNKGAEYSISATPFNHTAFDATTITTPANFEVVSKSVADFFQSTEGTDADTFQQALRAQTNAQRETPADAKKAAQPSINTIKADSYGTAINSWYRALQSSNKISIADVYRFEFLPDPDTGLDVIGSATFVEERRSTPKETPMKKNSMVLDSVSMRLSDLGSSQNVYDTTKAIFSINYGTTIEKLLEYVIRNSSYIQNQLVVPDGLTAEQYKAKKEEVKDIPLKWFRITSTVRILGFDDIRKVWAREITYTVKPYKMYNIRSDLGPQGVALYPVKNYNYMYTGKNSDVIDIDIRFNALYYNQTTAFRDNLAELSPTAESIVTEYETQNAPNYGGGDPPKGIDYNAVMPLIMRPVVQNSKAVATGNPTTSKEVAAADLADSLMSSSQADMVNVKLKIIGDPDYIKQDEIFYNGLSQQNIASKPTGDPRLLENNGSLIMDDGGVYVQVLFKIPQDIDDTTGFMKYDEGQRNSVFSGLYQVIQVQSSFSGGQFIQELELSRMTRQVAYDYVSGNNNKSNARISSATVGLQGTPMPTDPVPSILVSGGKSAPSTAALVDATSTIDQTAGQEQPAAKANNAEPPVETATQQDLKAVKDASPPAVPITEANQTPPNPPEPKPTEAKKAAEKAYFDFLATASPEQQAASNYNSLGTAIQRQQDDIAIREKNIERAQLRLARSDISEEARAASLKSIEENTQSIEFKRGLIAKDQAEREALKPAADAWNTKVKELSDARDNIA